MQKQKNKITTLSERGRPWRFEMITMNNKNNTFFFDENILGWFTSEKGNKSSNFSQRISMYVETYSL